MKKIKINSKLRLGKEVVTMLNKDAMSGVKGGIDTIKDTIILATGCVCGKSGVETCGIVCVDTASGHPATIRKTLTDL